MRIDGTGGLVIGTVTRQWDVEMVIERLILEFEGDETIADTQSGLRPTRLRSFETLQDFVDGVGDGDSPCAVVQIKMNRRAVGRIDFTECDPDAVPGADSSAADEPQTPRIPSEIRPPVRRSGSSRRQRVRDVLRSQARHAASQELVSHLDQTLETLSAREWDVLILMLEGRTCKEMGNELHIGLPTVAKHRARVLKHFDVRDHIELLLVLNNIIAERC